LEAALEIEAGDWDTSAAISALDEALASRTPEPSLREALVEARDALARVEGEGRTDCMATVACAIFTADFALSASPAEPEVSDAWQSWTDAPVNEVVDWWIASEDGGGWLKRGYRCNSADPLAIVEEDGGLYWPHENGGWPTHWQPLPEPPAMRSAAQRGDGG
jgi:hypothetical protein